MEPLPAVKRALLRCGGGAAAYLIVGNLDFCIINSDLEGRATKVVIGKLFLINFVSLFLSNHI